MRPIRFRVWHIARKEMVEFDRFYFSPSGEIIDVAIDDGNGHADKVPIDSVELTQFTGLFDKKRKPIYEGDILSIDAEEEYITAVEYDADGFVVDAYQEKDTSEHLVDMQPDWSVEVIGNIYQHGELLGEPS